MATTTTTTTQESVVEKVEYTLKVMATEETIAELFDRLEAWLESRKCTDLS